MEPFTRETLMKRRDEHAAARDQALAQANGNAGAVEVYERLLSELPLEVVEDGKEQDAAA